MSADGKAVCVPCRRVFKGEGREARSEGASFRRVQWPLRWMGTGAAMHRLPPRCPECRGPMLVVSYRWRPPKRTNDRAWKRIADGDLLWEHDPKTRVAPFRNPNWKKGQGWPPPGSRAAQRTSAGSRR